MIQDGKRAKVFGVTTAQAPGRPCPTSPRSDEQGLKGFDVKVWHGMYAPKGTPKEVIEQLTKALNVAIKDENVKKRIAELSSDLGLARQGHAGGPAQAPGGRGRHAGTRSSRPAGVSAD
ncbi:TctC protein [Alicycliphilus sp. B1]|nr:TctC protein [Alicycliphilus sp. B1]